MEPKDIELENYYLKKILKTLIDLKTHKDNNGKTGHYLTHQPKAWRDARNIINGDYSSDLTTSYQE